MEHRDLIVIGEGRSFGRADNLPHKERYARAAEFCHVVQKLWDSWEDNAFPRDKQSGAYFAPEKYHPIDHDERSSALPVR